MPTKLENAIDRLFPDMGEEYDLGRGDVKDIFVAVLENIAEHETSLCEKICKLAEQIGAL